jgi:hypothetical protein
MGAGRDFLPYVVVETGAWAGQPGFFELDERYAALSSAGLALVVEFELFRAELEAALDRSDRAKGGRPPYDPVLMFKVLVLQTLYTLSDDQTEYQIRDRALVHALRWSGPRRSGAGMPRPSGCSASN